MNGPVDKPDQVRYHGSGGNRCSLTRGHIRGRGAFMRPLYPVPVRRVEPFSEAAEDSADAGRRSCAIA